MPSFRTPVLLALVVSLVFAGSARAQIPCGDCDLNATVSTILDALQAARIASGLDTPLQDQTCTCDTDNSGSITVLDALAMAQGAAGLPTAFTCPSPVCGCTLVVCGAFLGGECVGAAAGGADFNPADSKPYLIDATARLAGQSVIVEITPITADIDLFVPVGMPPCGDITAASWVCAAGGGCGAGSESHYFDDATVTAFGGVIPVWVRHAPASPALTADYDFQVTCIGMPTFTFTGAQQTFAVPPGVNTVHIVARGASGAGGAGGAVGGLGAEATGDLAVTGGVTVLEIFVGGMGNTFNGGGPGGADGGGIGGGASDVRVGGITPANRVITAGGGGGGGGRGCEIMAWAGGDGGFGGGGTGGDGQSSPGNGGGGFGGAPGVGGAAGIGCACCLGQPGQASGQGGNGQTCCCFLVANFNPGGGGGGGGFVNGGGGGGGSAGTTVCSGNDKGGGGGGGGGTSDISGVTSGTMTSGVVSGDGVVIIIW